MLKSEKPRPIPIKGSHIFPGVFFKPEFDSEQPEKNNLKFQKCKNAPVELHPKHLQDEVSPQLKENKPIENNNRVIHREYEKYKTMLTLHKTQNVKFEEEFVAKLDIIARTDRNNNNDNNVREMMKESKRRNTDDLNSLKLKGEIILSKLKFLMCVPRTK